MTTLMTGDWRQICWPLTEATITYCDNTRVVELPDFWPKVGIAEGLTRTRDWFCQRYSIQQR